MVRRLAASPAHRRRFRQAVQLRVPGVALRVAVGPARPAATVILSLAYAGGEARHRRHAFTFKWATDALWRGRRHGAATRRSNGSSAHRSWRRCSTASRASPCLLVQVREAMFAKGRHARGAQAGVNTFEHMHRRRCVSISSADRRPHARARARPNGIENITRMTLMTSCHHGGFRAGSRRPHARVRLALRAGRGGDDLALLWFTVRATDWRIKIRRSMNESDTAQHQGHRQSAELRDGEVLRRRGARGQRYDKSMAIYESERQELHLAGRAQTAGRPRLYRGAHACMVMAGLDVPQGTRPSASS